MKTLISLLLFFFAGLLSSYAQVLPLPSDSAEWKYNQIYDPGGPCSELLGRKFTMEGDTVINGSLYSILKDWGYLRSDSNQVFFIPQDSIKEYLIYDFNLGVGDTFIVTWTIGGEPYLHPDTTVVYSIDSVLTNVGYRKVWNLDYASWIEGIGSPSHLTHIPYIGLTSSYYTLLCLKEKGELIYNDDYPCHDGTVPFPGIPTIIFTCDSNIYSTVSTHDMEESGWEVHPNPFKDILYFSASDHSSIQFIGLYSNVGKFIRKLPNQTRWDLSGLPSGVYIITVKREDRILPFRVVKTTE